MKVHKDTKSAQKSVTKNGRQILDKYEEAGEAIIELRKTTSKIVQPIERQMKEMWNVKRMHG